MARDSAPAPATAAFEIAGETVGPGERKRVDVSISRLSNHTRMHLSLQVLNGRKPGPVMFVSGALHGDEIIGVEIIRRIFENVSPRRLSGVLILAPIVNAYGFLNLSRYLPDRRDLNRSFPGSPSGSLASQLANVFMTEVVSRCAYGIDLHSGAAHRQNLPQVRGRMDDAETRELATAFGAPVILNSGLRDGSLRQAAQEAGCSILLYEAGEALRFDESAIRVGVRGVLGVMQKLGMLASGGPARKASPPVMSISSHWLRAPIGGVLRSYRKLGEHVEAGDRIAIVSDPFGETEEYVTARSGGLIIGRAVLPVVNRGDALYHVAAVVDIEQAREHIDRISQEVDEDPLFDYSGIV